MVELVSETEPTLINSGDLWVKPIVKQYTDLKSVAGQLTYVYYKCKWVLVYDVGNIGEMIEILSLFGEVKISKCGENKYFCCHMPYERGALWYFSNNTTLNESLDTLIKKAIEQKVIN